jgi:hypothetical protein
LVLRERRVPKRRVGSRRASRGGEGRFPRSKGGKGRVPMSIGGEGRVPRLWRVVSFGLKSKLKGKRVRKKKDDIIDWKQTRKS